MLEFSVLGPLEVRRDGVPVRIAGSRPRAVLALLVIHANEPVSSDRFAMALWGQDAPADAANAVQVYVSRLRRSLGEPHAVATTPAGYRLRGGADALDAEQFAALVKQAREAEPERAYALLDEALALWRGDPLADVRYAPFA